MKLRAGICRSRDHFSDRFFLRLFGNISTKENLQIEMSFRPARALLVKFLDLTFSGVDWSVALDDENSEVIGRSPSLRAPAVHGASSYNMFLRSRNLDPPEVDVVFLQNSCFCLEIPLK